MKRVLILSLPVTETANVGGTFSIAVAQNPVNISAKDLVVDKVRHVPKKTRKITEHVSAVLTCASDVILWTNQGEIIMNKGVIRVSHLYDLIKSNTDTQNVFESLRLKGGSV